MPIYIPDSSNTMRVMSPVIATTSDNVTREVAEAWYTGADHVSRLVYRAGTKWAVSWNNPGNQGNLTLVYPASDENPTIMTVGHSSTPSTYYGLEITATNVHVKAGDEIQIRFGAYKSGNNFFSMWDNLSDSYFWSIARSDYGEITEQTIVREATKDAENYKIKWGADDWASGYAKLRVYEILHNGKKIL